VILSVKKLFALGVVAVLFGAFSVYGMNFLAGRGVSSVTSVLTTGPLELKLELDKTEFERGEPVNITISLKNIGNTTITVTYAYMGTRVGVKILYSSNSSLRVERGRTPLTMVEPVAFAPGEQVSRTFVWDQWLDVIVESTYYGKQQAPEGTYTVVGTTGTLIGVAGTSVGGMLETPPITIIIR